MNGLKVNVVLHIALLVLTGLVFWLTGTGLKLTNEFFIIYGLVFSFACFIALMPRYRRDPWLTLSIQGVFFFSVGAGCAGVTSLAALRAQAPLQDALLARLDHDLGFSVPAFLYFCSGHQNLNRVLYVLYENTGLAIILLLFTLSLSRDRIGLQRLVFVFSSTSMICALCNMFTPAVGAVSYYHIPNSVMRAFPSGAGVYFLNTFHRFHSGAANSVALDDLNGVVTFPSFHAAMAVMVAWGLRRVPYVRVCAVLFALLIFPASLLRGGHYVIDLVGGATVCLAAILLSGKLIGGSVPTSAGETLASVTATPQELQERSSC